jgi:putative ABC transport system substrate-binding protein
MMEQVRIASLDVTLKSAIRNLKSAILAGALLFALCGSVQAQQPTKKVPVIGVFLPDTASAYASYNEAFLQGLRDLGYVVGQNIILEYRYSEGKHERLPALADELVRLKWT